jgi:hypothetical protein
MRCRFYREQHLSPLMTMSFAGGGGGGGGAFAPKTSV